MLVRGGAHGALPGPDYGKIQGQGFGWIIGSAIGGFFGPVGATIGGVVGIVVGTGVKAEGVTSDVSQNNFVGWNGNCYAPPLVYGTYCNSTESLFGVYGTAVSYSVDAIGDTTVSCMALGMGYVGQTQSWGYYNILSGDTLYWGDNAAEPSIYCYGNPLGTATDWSWTSGSESLTLRDFTVPTCSSQESQSQASNATCYRINNGFDYCASEMFIFQAENCKPGGQYLYNVYSDTECMDIAQTEYAEFGNCTERPDVPSTCGTGGWSYPYIVMECGGV